MPMPATSKPLSTVKDMLVVFLSASLLIAASMFTRPPTAPVADAEVYVGLALGLTEFGVFGKYQSPTLPPEPEAEVTPLYPAFLAGLMRLDSDLRGSLQCLAKQRDSNTSECPQNFTTMAAAQGLLMAVLLFSVWMMGWLLSRRRTLAWVSMVMAWYSGLPVHYANLFLTEALVLPLFGLFMLLLTLVYLQPRRWHWALGAGLILGLLALARPSFSYLFWFLTVVGVAALLVRPLRSRLIRSLCIFFLGYALVSLPWAVRNYTTFNQSSFNGGRYGGKSLAYRVSYNKMTPTEWAVAFVYWFPDIGDSLAKSLFSARLYEHLAWGKQSYFAHGNNEFQQALHASSKAGDSPVMYLLKHKILNQPVKHALVSLPLAWRGMFIHKYWSLFGWIGSLWLLARTFRARRYAYACLWTPGFFMLGFHAAVSVNMPRYNIILLPLLSIALAYLLLDIVSRRLGGKRCAWIITHGPASELYPAPENQS